VLCSRQQLAMIFWGQMGREQSDAGQMELSAFQPFEYWGIAPRNARR